ncbi:LysR family transcriptional regulator [Microlunatus antarcticus]|uniref:DNA-binding transcriptional LysR family regulator n=1 Tax=Microlunatus antarcticus TaxID=53388 RepID=A0A7W5P5W5_9ACTN|nr:LysR family transcriptional regulator [Microlunatus antarcticus]MBB3325879.1 DNA-binding transcriptional LysR family regulator [Microlunatus antarcticus]
MDLRRLRLLFELSRLGSMRAVAETHGLTTSTVSQQVAALAREVGAPLVEPDGRRVRLTPAGLRLADHAVTILAAVDTARADLDPEAEPSGTLRVGGFATAVRSRLLPVMAELEASHPQVRVLVREHEPLEALGLLAEDDLDLALTYDYNLAPAPLPSTMRAVPLWTTAWGLAVPADASGADPDSPVRDLRRWSGHDWIVNSRNTADERAVGTLGALAGFTPRITHRIDSLDLVEDLIVAGRGIGLLPSGRPSAPGTRLLALDDPPVTMTAYAVTRLGREQWAPLRLLLDRLAVSAAR